MRSPLHHTASRACAPITAAAACPPIYFYGAKTRGTTRSACAGPAVAFLVGRT
jgi:hypothetical protein